MIFYYEILFISVNMSQEKSNIKKISERESQFKNFGFSEVNYCLVGIKIEDLEYIDKKEKYYHITYNFEYSKERDISTHPFYNEKEMLENHSYGEIIYKNELTEKMIEYLLMDDIKLSQQIGVGTPYNYKTSIMKMITHLWA